MKGFFKFLFSATIGLVYGLLFAQKPGKKLREDLKKSKTPGKDVLNELRKMDKEARGTVATWAKNSDKLQKALKGGKKQLDAFVEKAKDMAEMAEKKAGEFQKEAMKKTRQFTNELEKKVKTAVTKPKAKKVTKKK